jgi:hypothetical protein
MGRYGRIGSYFGNKAMKVFSLRGAKYTAGFAISALVMFGLGEAFQAIKAALANDTSSNEEFMNQTIGQIATFYENLQIDRNETAAVTTLLEKLAGKFYVSLNDLKEMLHQTKIGNFTAPDGSFEKDKFIAYTKATMLTLIDEVKTRGWNYFFRDDNNNNNTNSTDDDDDDYEQFDFIRDNDNSNKDTSTSSSITWPMAFLLVILAGIFVLLGAIVYSNYKVRGAEEVGGVSRARSFASFLTLSR